MVGSLLIGRKYEASVLFEIIVWSGNILLVSVFTYLFIKFNTNCIKCFLYKTYHTIFRHSYMVYGNCFPYRQGIFRIEL